MSQLTDELVAGAERLGIPLARGQVELFERFLAQLLDWNTRINLTAIRKPQDIVSKHFLDSLTLLRYLPGTATSTSILDVGTGGGFPGIPLAIVRPTFTFTLLEATHKKVRFLDSVIRDLPLPNAQAIWGRSEKISDRFDVVTARAIGDFSKTLQLTIPRSKPGGWIILPRGPKDDSAQSEIRNLAGKLGARVEKIHSLTLPLGTDRRTIWVLQKNKT